MGTDKPSTGASSVPYRHNFLVCFWFSHFTVKFRIIATNNCYAFITSAKYGM